MKTLSTLILFIFITSLSSLAFAQTKIGVLDQQRILSQSKAGQDIQEQVKTLRDEMLDEITQKESRLREKEKSIIEKRDTLTKEQLEQERREFESELLETRRFAQEQKNAMDEAFLSAMAVLQKELFSIVQQIAADNGYELIFTRSNVYLGEKSIDISDEALKKLDEKLTAVPVTLKTQ